MLAASLDPIDFRHWPKWFAALADLLNAAAL